MINVNVVNDPPEITCSVLIAREDTPLPIQVSRLRQGSRTAIRSR